MQRTMKMICTVVLLLTASTAGAHGGPELNVDGPVHPDGAFRVSGEDLTPMGVQSIELRRTGGVSVVLGQVPTDDDGGFYATLHVPADLQLGFYQVLAQGTVSATTQVEVTAPQAVQTELPPVPQSAGVSQRGKLETALLAIAVALLAALGIFLVSRPQRLSH